MTERDSELVENRSVADLDPVDFPTFELANRCDCERYGVGDNPSLWGARWAMEKFKAFAPVKFGFLDISQQGTFFEIYQLIRQPHPFYALLRGSEKMFPKYIKCRREELHLLKLEESCLDLILCHRGLQFLPESHFEQFITFASRSLKRRGILVVSFAILLNLSMEAANIFRGAEILHRVKSAIPCPERMISYVAIHEIAPQLELINEDGSEFAFADKEYLENVVLPSNKHLVKNKYKELFLTVFSEGELGEVLPALETVITNAGLLLRKAV